MKYFLLLAAVVLISCNKEKEPEIQFSQTTILNRNDTIQIPVSLREQIEEDYFTLSPRPVERTATQKKVLLSNLTREYMSFSAFLLDRQAVLKEPSYLFKMDGGGTIDLAQYLNGKAGEFSFGFKLNEVHTAANTKVYFLNYLKAQGCETFRDVTSYFFSTMNKKGLITNTKDLIHLKLLVGAFVILSNIDDKYYIGQVYVTDSRAEKALCR